MDRPKRSRSRSDRQPWDPANGIRVGTVVGGLLGAALVALTGFANIWVVALAGIAGGAAGFWSEKRKQPDRPGPSDPGPSNTGPSSTGPSSTGSDPGQ